jgi:hypothetical protein
MTSPEQHEEVLYADWSVDEITEYMQGEQSADVQLKVISSSLFKAHVVQSIRQGFDVYWTALEAKWREVTDNKPLPSKHRSAKSVIRKALEIMNGLPSLLVDENELPLGKTAIEKHIKLYRGSSNSPDIVRPKTVSACLDKLKRVVESSRAGLTDEEYDEFIMGGLDYLCDMRREPTS